MAALRAGSIQGGENLPHINFLSRRHRSPILIAAKDKRKYFCYGYLGIEVADTFSHDVSRVSSRDEAFMERDELQTLRELCSKNTERRRPGPWRLVRRSGVLVGVLRAIREQKAKPKHSSDE